MSTKAQAASIQQAPPACLLDASIYIFRSYFSLPDHWFSESGQPTAAVYGYTRFLLSVLRDIKPQWMLACFDESLGSCFRNHIYPAYKSSRALPDEDLAFQLQACREVTELLGISCVSSTEYEADDLLGSAMHLLHNTHPELTVAVLTRDKDLGQLLTREQDYLWDFSGKSSAHNQQNRHAIKAKFGVWPEQLADYLALVGDSIDDIPGVPGVGAKTAQALLNWQPSLVEIFRHSADLSQLPIRGASKLERRLNDHQEQISMARVLAEIVTDAELNKPVQALRVGAVDQSGLMDFCRRMGLPKQLIGA